MSLKKSTHHTKTQNLKQNEERQSIDANSQKTEMLDLPDKDLKVAMLSMFQ